MFQSQRLPTVQLGAGEDLPAHRWNVQMWPGMPAHPPQGNVICPDSCLGETTDGTGEKSAEDQDSHSVLENMEFHLSFSCVWCNVG